MSEVMTLEKKPRFAVDVGGCDFRAMEEQLLPKALQAVEGELLKQTRMPTASSKPACKEELFSSYNAHVMRLKTMRAEADKFLAEIPAQAGFEKVNAMPQTAPAIVTTFR